MKNWFSGRVVQRLLAAGVLIGLVKVGMHVPVPGVDAEALADFARGGRGAFAVLGPWGVAMATALALLAASAAWMAGGAVVTAAKCRRGKS